MNNITLNTSIQTDLTEAEFHAEFTKWLEENGWNSVDDNNDYLTKKEMYARMLL